MTTSLVPIACGAPSTGGGAPAAGTAAPGAASAGGGTLKIALFGTEVGGGDKATTDSFKAKHPGVNVEITPNSRHRLGGVL